LIALALGALIILVVLAINTARSVIRPVRSLIGAARRIARGDFESEVPRGGSGELVQLARALDEMRVDLRDAEAARAEVDRLKDEFVSSVSHELRTPLGYIKGYTTTLLRRDAKWDERQVRAFLKIIEDSSDQLEGLVDHLLDMSRISEGRLSVHPEPVALSPIVRDVARRSNVRSAEHEIKVHLPSDLPHVMADRGRVMQVLGNLLDNGIKYSPEGGAVTISAAVRGDEVEVTVRDQGIGIPADHLSAVFERFHRVSDPRVGAVRGTGLGLPICRAIVEAHGGRIWADQPADGPGAVLRFTLPVAPLDVQPEPAAPPAAAQNPA
jgi:signal transduction histidine kinase